MTFSHLAAECQTGGAVPAVDGVADVMAAYPGPALLIGDGARVDAANVAAERLLTCGAAWLPSLIAWAAQPGGPGAAVSTIRIVREGMIATFEWTAVPLSSGAVLVLGRDTTAQRQLHLALVESRQRFRTLVEISGDFVWETNAAGRLCFVSARGFLGYPADALIGSDPDQLLAIGSEEGEDAIASPFKTQRPVMGVELWVRTADGSDACLSLAALPVLDGDGLWTGARGVCRDVTEQVSRSYEQERRRIGEHLLGRLARSLGTRFDAFDGLDRDAEEACRLIGSEGAAIYRLDARGELVLAGRFGVMPPGLPVLARANTGAAARPVLVAVDGLTALIGATQSRDQVNGVLCAWGGTPGWADDGGLLFPGMADQFGIALARIARHEEMRRLSERDELTGLFNRRCFLARLDEMLERAEAGASTLLFIDLDNFKALNDSHGHARGDQVLREIAGLLNKRVRPGDLAGRLGGDEFVLWLGRTDAAAAVQIAGRVIEGVRILAHLSADPHRPLGASIGLAVFRPGGGDGAQELIHRADQAMYAAKRAGKNRVAITGADGTAAVVTERTEGMGDGGMLPS